MEYRITSLHDLKKISNAAARMVTSLGKYDDLNDEMKKLPAGRRIQ